MDYGLQNRIVLVTGTNNPEGIGAATALAFAEEGAKVAMVYKKLDFQYDETKIKASGFDRYHKALSGDCSEIVRKIKQITPDYLVIEGDISDENTVKSIFDSVEARFGKVDILVNNAAAYHLEDSIFQITVNAIDDVFGTNVKGTLLMIREFVKRFGGYGRIVNLSTDAAQVMPGQIAYGSSKATIEAFTRSIAMEVGHLGITVNTIAPGPIQTGWVDKELEQKVVPMIPMGRLGTPQDIVDAILFLASDKASWLTGQVIKVSGGHAL